MAHRSRTGRSPPHSSPSASTNHLAADLSQVLLDAMRNHLVSDVPVLIFLSGGTDSACLGALARAAGANNLSAMTVGFGESDFDESKADHPHGGSAGHPARSGAARSAPRRGGHRPCCLGAG